MTTILTKFTGKRLRDLMFSELNRFCMSVDPEKFGIPGGNKRDEVMKIIHNIMYDELRNAYLSNSQLTFMQWYKQEYEDFPPFVEPFTDESPPDDEGELPDWLRTDSTGI